MQILNKQLGNTTNRLVIVIDVVVQLSIVIHEYLDCITAYNSTLDNWVILQRT